MKTIVYRTENKKNGRFYYGVHTLSDKTKYYLGSGKILKQAVDKYGKDNFVRRTVKEFDNAEDAYAFEKLIVSAVKSNPLCYNIQDGGFGGQSDMMREIAMNRPPMSKETKRKISNTLKGNSNRRVPIVFDGVEYPSRKAAAEALGLTVDAIYKRLQKLKKGGSNEDSSQSSGSEENKG